MILEFRCQEKETRPEVLNSYEKLGYLKASSRIQSLQNVWSSQEVKPVFFEVPILQANDDPIESTSVKSLLCPASHGGTRFKPHSKVVKTLLNSFESGAIPSYGGHKGFFHSGYTGRPSIWFVDARWIEESKTVNVATCNSFFPK